MKIVEAVVAQQAAISKASNGKGDRETSGKDVREGSVDSEYSYSEDGDEDLLTSPIMFVVDGGGALPPRSD